MIIAVMPAHNEAHTIEQLVKGAKRFVDTVVVVDDASSDNTALLARRAGAVVVRHPQNRGLGAALRSGFAEALARKATVIVTIDADGQHDPHEIPQFISKIREGYDFVLGRRNLVKYPLRKRIGNFFLNMATNLIAGTRLDDTESGFRAFSRQGLAKLVLRAKRYEIAAEIIFEVGRNNLRATNVPISSTLYVKGVGVLDGLRNFYYLLHRRRRTLADYLSDAKYVIRKNLRV